MVGRHFTNTYEISRREEKRRGQRPVKSPTNLRPVRSSAPAKPGGRR